MKPIHKQITVAALAVALLVTYVTLCEGAAGASGHLGPDVVAKDRAPSPQNSPGQQPARTPTPTVFVEDTIEARDETQRGIVVGRPRVYDDAMLQQMLQTAEARLAALQVLDQAQILSRLGAISGASQQISSGGLNVQGAPVPGVTTATTLPTLQTTQTTAAGATSSGLTTVSGLGTENVTTTQPQFNPPGATAPAPTTTLPSSGFSVSSSDILNEQLQLTAEINGLRLMLAGDLSSHFVKRGTNNMTKLKTTLGFPITLIPDERFKDAVAVVEVEVVRAGQSLSNEPPSVTALLPREKTYNVAEITDKSSSISGGVATQLIGIGGSWVRGHKTYYLVQDQDTLALDLPSDADDRASFMWEFRPVLGRRYVRGGLKQTFVQLSFPVPSDAREGEIGRARVRTYWRKYDRKHRIHKEIVPNSVSVRDIDFEIPRYSLAVHPPVLNPLQSLEDLGDGKMLVRLPGRFLPGTYVRIGAKLLNARPQFAHEHSMIRFVATIPELATKKVFLVAHDGTEVPLTFEQTRCGLDEEFDADGNVIRIRSRATFEIEDGTAPTVTTLDDKNSLLKLNFVVQNVVFDASGAAIRTEVFKPTGPEDIPGIVLSIGPRVFGYSDGPMEMAGNTLTAVLPSALLAANRDITLQLLFPRKGCRTTFSLDAFNPPSQAERLVILEQNPTAIRLLLYGTRLSGLRILDPARLETEDIGEPGDADRLRLITLTPAQFQSRKNLLVQRPGNNERPFLIALPELSPKPPEPLRAKEAITTRADEATILGDGLKEVESVTLNDTAVDFKVEADGKSMRLLGLRALNPNASAQTMKFLIKLKGEAKPREVEVRVFDNKLETSMPK